ncbi:hypothetical protein C8R45DRAFT_1182072 [Mycena sanguinolenta]|nr:hypothetical protein C8R45DRAFT_1182072 [Mycena sanguinolenta]
MVEGEKFPKRRSQGSTSSDLSPVFETAAAAYYAALTSWNAASTITLVTHLTRIGGITPDRAAAAAAAQLMHVPPSITCDPGASCSSLHLATIPSDVGHGGDREWRWLGPQAVRQVGAARDKRGRRGTRTVRTGSAHCVARARLGSASTCARARDVRPTTRLTPIPRNARNAHGAVQTARPRPHELLPNEYTVGARTHLRVPPASAPAGDAGAADREAWAVRDDPFSLPALTACK